MNEKFGKSRKLKILENVQVLNMNFNKNEAQKIYLLQYTFHCLGKCNCNLTNIINRKPLLIWRIKQNIIKTCVLFCLCSKTQSFLQLYKLSTM